MRPYAEPSLCWVPLTGGTNHRSCIFWTALGTESCLGLIARGNRVDSLCLDPDGCLMRIPAQSLQDTTGVH